MSVAAPFRYTLPMVGRLYYEPQITILAVVTLIGAIAAGAIAYAYGGMRGFAIVASLQAALTLSVIAPIAAQPGAWAPPPPDIDGVTTAVVLLVSVLVAAPGIVLGVLFGWRMGAAPVRWIPVLAAAGAYYLTCVVMSLPTPQLDLRMALPYTAGFFTGPWHAVVIAAPAIVAGIVLGSSGVRLITSMLSGATMGLAGALPIEIGVIALGPSSYVPVSAVGVPLATAVITAGVAVAARRMPRDWLHRSMATPQRAAFAGLAVAIATLVAWSLLAQMPTSADRDARVDAYRETGDERKIVACVTSGRGEQVRTASAREGASSVTLTIRLRRDPSWYFHDLAGIPLPALVVLREPLGTRVVIDGSTGERVRSVPPGTTVASFC
jgi:hypothetical protein